MTAFSFAVLVQDSQAQKCIQIDPTDIPFQKVAMKFLLKCDVNIQHTSSLTGS